jgi:carbonic anhydrase
VDDEMNYVKPDTSPTEELDINSIQDYCRVLGTLHKNLETDTDDPSPSSTRKMPAPSVRDLLDRHGSFKKSYQSAQTIPEMQASGQAGARVIIVTCADPRCDPYEFLNLKGFDAVSIRSIGGRVQHQLEGIIAVDSIMNFEEIVVIHHTDCGATYFTTPNIRKILQERAPGKASEIDALRFGDFSREDIPGSVKEDLEILRNNEFLSKALRENAHGFVFDIKTGELKDVEA